MIKKYFVFGLLIIFGSAFIVSAMADVNFILPLKDPSNWKAEFDSEWHIHKDAYAFDFNSHPGGNVGQPIVAAADGVVVTAAETTTSGGKVLINHGSNLESVYEHLDARTLLVKSGDTVKQGDIIGYTADQAHCGQPAYCMGPHLHFAVYTVGNNGSLSAYDIHTLPVFSSVPVKGPSWDIVKSGSVFASAVKTSYKVGEFFSGGGSVGGSQSVTLTPVKAININEMFGGQVSQLYDWALGVAASLALLIIIWSGVLYIASAGNSSKQGEAKEWFKAAIYGLLLLLAAYLILNTINPCILGVGTSCG